jgi:hypothetical protein
MAAAGAGLRLGFTYYHEVTAETRPLANDFSIKTTRFVNKLSDSMLEDLHLEEEPGANEAELFLRSLNYTRGKKHSHLFAINSVDMDKEKKTNQPISKVFTF